MSVAEVRSPSGSLNAHNRDDFRRIPLCRLKIGHTLRFPIHADDGVLLLAQGSQVTSRILDILSQRGFTNILVHRFEAAAQVAMEPTGSLESVPSARAGAMVGIHNKHTRLLDQGLAEFMDNRKENDEPSFMKEIPAYGTTPYSETLARELFQKHESSIDTLREAITSITSAKTGGEKVAGGVVNDYLNVLSEDVDLFTNLATAPSTSYYPHRHSLHVAMLSLAMGVRAGMGEQSLKTLGLSAMLHDIGMMRVPRSIWNSRQALTSQQQITIMAHPIYSVDMISQCPAIPQEVSYIIYQVHERPGGGGYPRRVPSAMIHPMSKIIATADSYVALLSERPHRKGVQPYRAIESMIQCCTKKNFDVDSIRLLLKTVSLYPIGSYVLLSDGRLAKVMRTNEFAYDKPVVRAWPRRAEPSEETGEMINLANAGDLKVVETLPSPAALEG